jgi:hypothetical protein
MKTAVEVPARSVPGVLGAAVIEIVGGATVGLASSLAGATTTSGGSRLTALPGYPVLRYYITHTGETYINN